MLAIVINIGWRKPAPVISRESFASDADSRMSDAMTISSMERGKILIQPQPARTTEAPEADPNCCFGGTLTPNAKVLLVAMSSSSVITVAQTFGAVASNSNALMVDCVSMAVDAVSYGVSATTEVWPDKNKKQQEGKQLITSAISYALLMCFTMMFMLDAKDTIMDERKVNGKINDSINPYVVFAFALFG